MLNWSCADFSKFVLKKSFSGAVKTGVVPTGCLVGHFFVMK